MATNGNVLTNNLPTIAERLIANVVPCKKWIDCETRSDETKCVVKIILSAICFDEIDLTNGDGFAEFWALVSFDFISQAIGSNPNYLFGEIETMGACRFFEPIKVKCPTCGANVEPSSITNCPNCRETRCRACNVETKCRGCSRVLCPGCIIVEKHRYSVRRSCYFCNTKTSSAGQRR